MDEVKILRHAVDGGVHAHRRDHDAIGQAQVAQLQGLEQRHIAGIAPRLPGEGGAGLGHEIRRAQQQIVPGDGLAARHHAEGELRRVEMPEALDVFEPDQADIGGVLGLLHRLAPRGLIAFEACRHVATGEKRLMQRDGILHGQLGAGTDGKMRRRLGVAD